MQPHDFPKTFAALTGVTPFPWQITLYLRLIGGDFPKAASLPTGLGKTSIIAIWLCALATKPEAIPRRLVYVVNRRTVVDQTTAEVAKWRNQLRSETLSNLAPPLAALSAIPLAPGASPLAISTLRGQFADNREWSADPARPAVIVGTVDMIGSRLLFNSYGAGFKTRPHHAGFLGQDTLVVHDEAHLEPAFQRLLETLAARQITDRDLRPLRVLALSATNRDATETSHALTEADHENPIVRKRTHAAKKPTLHDIADEKKELADKLTSLALARRDSGRAVLIFARSLDVVHRVAAALEKAKVANTPVKLVGPLRGLERDRLVEHPVFQRFIPPSNRVPLPEPIPTGTVYLVATSAGEVGVNLSADDLVCDLSTFESMAQRLGRVNRFGELTDSTVDLVHPEKFDEKDPLSPARQQTLALFRLLEAGGTASPAALSDLDPIARLAAFSPEPTILPATDILFDAWSLTTIRGALPGRPPVAAYLHGEADWEPPETHVAWRQEVDWITPALAETHRPADLLADYPLRPHELLRDQTSRVHEQLKKLAERPDAASRHVWLVDEAGEIAIHPLSELADKNADDKLQHRTVLLPPSLGGLKPDGSLDGNAPPGIAQADVSDEPPDRKAPRERIRIRADVLEIPADFLSARFIRPRIDLEPEADSADHEITETGDDTAQTSSLGRYWYWLESPRAIAGANLHQAKASILLTTHTSDVAQLATAIADKLKLPPDLRRAIILAARFHDAGKHRTGWQKSIGNPNPTAPLAKAGPDLRPRSSGEHYRHEFGSLLDVSIDPEFVALPDDEQDVVLHLIAAHHGRARPHFPADEATDPDAALADVTAVTAAVPLRFARLQRRFGRWGLAYLESILRAADYAASAQPSTTVEDTK
jgi:CRISPR-associated endonuclease/helicase Cas3